LSQAKRDRQKPGFFSYLNKIERDRAWHFKTRSDRHHFYPVKVSIMLSHEQNQVQIADGKFVETGIDPTSEIPYLLMLIGDDAGNDKVYDPKENYSASK
jgi:hypothetical protein